MRRIEGTFKKLKKGGERALIAYITAGDPRPELTPKMAGALVEGGADILELGVPFSDPIADGPTIQAATVRALRAGTAPRSVLDIAHQIQDEHQVPIVILTYYNPILAIGLENFFSTARRGGVDGVIVPDLPIEEGQRYKRAAEKEGIDTIFLASPSTKISRLKGIAKLTSGFLYLVSLYGVTGARERIEDLTVSLVRRFRPHLPHLPLAVGFGISQPHHVKKVVEAGADGAIVGSAFVNIIEKYRDEESILLMRIKKYAQQLKRATVKAE